MFKHINNNWFNLKNIGQSFLYSVSAIALTTTLLYNLPTNYQKQNIINTEEYSQYLVKNKNDLKIIEESSIKIKTKKEPIIVVVDNGEHADNVISIIKGELHQSLPEYENNIVYINKFLSIEEKSEEELKNIVNKNYNISNIDSVNFQELQTKTKELNKEEIPIYKIIEYFGEKYDNNIYINMSYGSKTGIIPEVILESKKNINIFQTTLIKDFVYEKNKEYDLMFKKLNNNKNIKLFIAAGNNEKVEKENKEINNRDYMFEFYSKITNNNYELFPKLSEITKKYFFNKNTQNINENEFFDLLKNEESFKHIENNTENLKLLKVYLKYSQIDLNSDFDKYLLMKKIKEHPELKEQIIIVEAISPDSFLKNYKNFKKQKEYNSAIKLMAFNASQNKALNIRDSNNFYDFYLKYKDENPELFISSYSSLTNYNESKNMTEIAVENQLIEESFNKMKYIGGTSFATPFLLTKYVEKDFEDSKTITTFFNLQNDTANEIRDLILE